MYFFCTFTLFTRRKKAQILATLQKLCIKFTPKDKFLALSNEAILTY